jgi:hypothetical protein
MRGGAKEIGARLPARWWTARAGVAMLVSLVLVCLAPTAASAAIKIYQSSEAATYLGEVRRAKCKVRRLGNGRSFHAGARTTNGAYTLDVSLFNFRGFNRTYNVQYGVLSATVSLEGVSNGADYDNVFPFPGGQPPGSAGSIRFARDGAKLGLGIYALPNQDYSQGVVLAGGMKCDYPSRR